MNIIIPIGGKGSRFANQGYAAPKHMIQVFNKPIVSYILDCIKQWMQPTDQVWVIYYTKNDGGLTTYIKDSYPFVNLVPIQCQTRGAAETVNLAMSQICQLGRDNNNEPCLLLDTDSFYLQDICASLWTLGPDENGIVYFEQPAIGDGCLHSYITMDGCGIVSSIKEKERISHNANTGAYYFARGKDLIQYTTKVIRDDIRFNGEYYISCVIACMLQDGHVFKGVQVDMGSFVSLGTPSEVGEYVGRTRAFLFDLDGTLVNTDAVYMNVWTQLLSEFNISLTQDVFKRYIQGNNDFVALSSIFSNHIPVDIGKISKMKDDIFFANIGLIEPIGYSIDFVKHVKRMGHKVVVVTNSNRVAAEAILKHMCLFDILDGLVIGNECCNPKPFPDPYMKAMQMLDMPNTKCFIFEDSVSGVLSARGVSPKCIIGVENDGNRAELALHGTHLQIKSFDEIIERVDELIGNEIVTNINEIENLIRTFSEKTFPCTNVHVWPNKLRGGFIADVLGIDVVHDNGTILTCVVKIMSDIDTGLSRMAKNLDLYGREFYFYEHIQRDVCVKTPMCHGIIRDSNYRSRAIVLENLNNADFVLNLNLNEVNIDVSLTVIKRIAQLHAQFMGKDIKEAFPLLRKNNDVKFCPSFDEFVKSRWLAFEDKWGCVLSTKQLDLGRTIAQKFGKVQEFLSIGNLTLCHGDVKSANIFYKKLKDVTLGYEPYFIDWQYIVNGKGTQDLVFFMIESFNAEFMKTHSVLFKEYYYIQLSSYNASVSPTYTREEFENDFMASVCYFPFYVAMWFGTIQCDDLIDKNFPFFYIQKLFSFMEMHVSLDKLENVLHKSYTSTHQASTHQASTHQASTRA
jgi:beta-phosphoglucomutase-like phosphatase (HAD superfamily)/choline kinase